VYTTIIYLRLFPLYMFDISWAVISATLSQFESFCFRQTTKMGMTICIAVHGAKDHLLGADLASHSTADHSIAR
jgi:hypothetical protein